MGVLDMPKAIYKAQQAKKKMSQIEVIGTSAGVSVLLNGISEVKEIEVGIVALREMLGDANVNDHDLEKLSKKLSENLKSALADAKKKLEKELMNSSNLDELKGLLGG